MKLFEHVEVFATLRQSDPNYIAITRNKHGAIYAFGNSANLAIEALSEAVKAARTPPTTFTETYGPRDAQEWQAEYGDWWD